MARIKKTRSSLREQRDALKRFERYLPTLELKKQQLKVEVRRVESRVERRRKELEDLRASIESWVDLFAENINLELLLDVRELKTHEENIAGVDLAMFDGVVFDRETIDIFTLPPWIDDGLEVLEKMIEFRAELAVLDQARGMLAEELRITSQRVNLFDKVKIPECEENIQTIKVALGDAQTAAVVRAKIAKEKVSEMETAAV